jgi:hypothetical protein
MKHQLLTRGVCISLFIFVLSFPFHFALAIPFTNGDFSDPVPLFGYIATGTVISEPTGEFAQLETDGNFMRTLEQTFTVPSLSTTLSFDFAFSTDDITPSGFFPDSFAASLLTTVDGDFLDILVVDAFGPFPDPSDGIEWITGAVPIDVTYDSSVSIAGFTPIAGGQTFSGRISLDLPAVVLGEEATLYFDLFDESDGFNAIAAVDNINVTPVPEPATGTLILTGLAGLCWFARKKAKKNL